MKKIKLFFVLLLSLSVQLSFAQWDFSSPAKIHTEDGVKQLGIRTNNPVHTLDILDDDYASIGLSHQGNGGSLLNLFTIRPDRNQSIHSGTISSGNQGWRIMAFSKYSNSRPLANDLVFSYWNDLEWKSPFVLDHATGNLGIGGVDNPTEALDVNGNIKLKAFRSLQSGADARISLYNNTKAQNSRTWIELWGNHDQRAGELAIAGTFMRFLTNSTTSTIGTESMRIAPNGYIGMGTTTPKKLLHVNGDYYGKGHVFYHAYEGDGQSGNAYIQARDLSGSSSINLKFRTQNAGKLVEAMNILANGNIGVGTVSVPSGYKLAVDGKVICEELKVQLSQNWADYVFAEDYQLRELSDVKQYVQEHKHLPGVPSAAEIEAEGGFEMGEMQRVMMEKIEELTLYLIDLKEDMTDLKKENENLKKQVDELEKE